MMSVEDELSMGEASPVEQVDEAPEQAVTDSEQELLDPAGFDFKAFVEGTRTARVSHRLYSRADLDVEIAAAANDLHEALSLGVRGLIVEREKRVQALKRQYFASGMDVVLEERSRDWQARETKKLKAAGVTGEHEIVLGLIAGQVVSPAGVTADLLSEFREVAPGQIKNLVNTWRQLQNLEAKGLPVF